MIGEEDPRKNYWYRSFFVSCPLIGHADIYKCEVEGQIVFSQTPYADDAMQIDEDTWPD